MRQTGGNPISGYVRVTALVEDALGIVSSVPMGAVTAGSSSAPSPQVVLTASLLALLPGEHTPVELVFEGVGGSFEIDEVWVDPYGGH